MSQASRRTWTRLRDSMGYGGRYETSLEDKLNLEDPRLAQAVIGTWKYRLVGDTDDPMIGFLGEALATSIYLYMKYWKRYGDLALLWETSNKQTQYETLKLFTVLSKIISNLIIALKVLTNEPIDFQAFERFLGKRETFNE